MTDLIQELRDGLEGTTPGQWSVKPVKGYCMDYIVTDHPDHQGPHHANYVAETGNAGGQTGPQRFEQDSAHMARCSPDNIRAILDRLEAAEKARDEARAALEDFYIIPKAMTDEEWREVKYNVDRKADPNIPLWRIQECIKWAAFETSVRTARARALAKEQTNG